MPINAIEIILYVHDQQAACAFYTALLKKEPALNVPGMTAFDLMDDHLRLGLMPNAGIARILGRKTPHPETGLGIPRCELYLHVPDPDAAYAHALACGALEINPPANRDWGDRAAYVLDPDGHVLAFAKRL